MFDAIVLGTGGIGSAALYHLARRGARVLGLDRFPGGHDQGSSHGDTRIIRMAYFEHPDYVPLLRRAYELWSELERAADTQLFHQVGLLQAGPEDGEVVPGVLRSAVEHGLEVERYSADELRRKFPGFRAPDNCVGVFERQAGYLLVEKCVLTHLRLATQAGADHQTGHVIQGWSREGDKLVVRTDRGRFETRKLIVTAGPWAARLLADLRLPLRVLRKPLHWMAAREPWYRPEQGGGTFLFELPHGVFYGFPQIDEHGVKMAEHSGGLEIDDPITASRDVDPTDFARVREFAAQCMPGLASHATRHAVCFYTMTPDGHFVVDRHPHDPDVAFVAGLSGHGFKFASVLGEVTTQLALDGATPLPIEFLSAQRTALKT